MIIVMNLELVQESLAHLPRSNVPNLKISANFDLAYDPGNKHAIPFNWGTSGLVVRSDLIEEPIADGPTCGNCKLLVRWWRQQIHD